MWYPGGKVIREAGPVKGGTSEIAFVQVAASPSATTYVAPFYAPCPAPSLDVSLLQRCLSDSNTPQICMTSTYLQLLVWECSVLLRGADLSGVCDDAK